MHIKIAAGVVLVVSQDMNVIDPIAANVVRHAKGRTIYNDLGSRLSD
ncbi:MAG: hypothetical protein L3J36_10585 [Rhodobacteraceae bacterium]|nr:hypothetical protein [Paracoccaceae bacterium]